MTAWCRAGGSSKGTKKVGLVGKGLTFDSGGYNLKVAAPSFPSGFPSAPFAVAVPPAGGKRAPVLPAILSIDGLCARLAA